MSDDIHTKLPNLTCERLEVLAQSHADNLALDRGYYDAVGEYGSMDALVVNMLRHVFTDYDDDQSPTRHAAANAAMAARYPWLATECDRQIQRREADERFEAAALADLAEQERIVKERRQETVAASRAVCGSFHVGQPVDLRVAGRDRCGTVVKVGRSRLTVEYQIKTGAARTAVVYASTVTSANGGEKGNQS